MCANNHNYIKTTEVPSHDVANWVSQHTHIDILYDALALAEHPHPLLAWGLVATKLFAIRTHSADAILNTPPDALHVKITCPSLSFSLPKT
jgi:hypothetical protein